jgi:uncharacterized membrane protein
MKYFLKIFLQFNGVLVYYKFFQNSFFALVRLSYGNIIFYKHIAAALTILNLIIFFEQGELIKRFRQTHRYNQNFFFKINLNHLEIKRRL